MIALLAFAALAAPPELGDPPPPSPVEVEVGDEVWLALHPRRYRFLLAVEDHALAVEDELTVVKDELEVLVLERDAAIHLATAAEQERDAERLRAARLEGQVEHLEGVVARQGARTVAAAGLTAVVAAGVAVAVARAW